MRANARHQVRTVLGGLDQHMPVPWHIDGLVNRLAAHRNRPITLVAWQFPSGDSAPSGLWIPSAQADYIFYDADASPGQREQIIGHELGHMLLEHTPRLRDAPPEMIEALAPSVSPDLARRFLALARTGYGEQEEAVAEEFGTSLIRRGVTRRAPGESDELGRLTDALR